MRTLLVLALVLALVLGAVACTAPARAPRADGTIAVVATTTQLTDFAKAIGGAHVTVFDVLAPNIDPHDFEPSPADLDAFYKADVIIKNGVGLESWFDDTLRSADARGVVVDASQGIALRGEDPHVWHNPQNAILMVRSIERAFERARPDLALELQRNLATYVAQLEDLDVDIRNQLGMLTNKRLVTNHDALGYYVEHFGLELVGSIIPSFDSSAELSARQIDQLVVKIKETGTKAVFSESSLPEKTGKAIGDEAGVRVVTGEHALYGDSLGPSGSDGDTYLKMEEHNTKVIVDNLR